MLDTVKLRSGYLDEQTAKAVEVQMHRTQRIDLASGEILYQLTGNLLPGSYDHRVSVRVCREDLKAERTLQERLQGRKRVVPITVPSEPYLIIEGSVHKALLGHNVYGGPADFQAPCRWLVKDLGKRLGVSLPDGRGWEVIRADWAEVYDLGSFEAVQEFLGGLTHARFPRREVGRYGEHSVHCGGYTTAVKLYHKGVEFASHDAPRLKDCFKPEQLEELQLLANRMLRVEVSVKHRKIRADLGLECQVEQVTTEYLKSVHDQETGRLLREGMTDMQVVRTFKEVKARLYTVYGARLGSTLFATWAEFAAIGEDSARKTMKRSKFYEHRKLLEQAGCSWHLSDIHLAPAVSAIPLGFSPVRSDPRRLITEAPEVVQALEGLRLAA